MTMETRLCYHSGRLQPAATGETRDVICPGTGEAVARIAWCGAADAELALASARDAADQWRELPIAERCEWLLDLREACGGAEQELRTCIHLEAGKPFADTAYEFGILMDALGFYAEAIRHLKGEQIPDPDSTHAHSISYEAAGVVVAALAWNFPLLNVAYKLAPALAAGCPILLKPSSETPLSACKIGELCAEIKLPAGVVSVLAGSSSSLGQALCESSIPAVITLIGSTATGCKMMRAGSTSIKRYSMELGGNAPALVFEDADLAVAADTISTLKFSNAGQICVAPNRVFVHKAVFSELLDMLCERASKIVVGFDEDDTATMGPLVTIGQRDWVDELVQEAGSRGAECCCGGRVPEGRGYFYPPTILRSVTNSMRIAREEVFGPVISLIEFEDEAEVLRQANDTDAGLASYVFTRDSARVHRCARALRFGEVQVNGFKYAMDLPHWGMKQSGMGCDCSQHALFDYLAPKRVTVKL